MTRRRRLWQSIGPGFITGASDDDPSGILTYSQTGARFGYRHLWTVVLTLPFMTVVQEMCGRIGMVTGQGLSAVIRKHYAKPVLYIAVSLLFVANSVNVGANLGAMASSAQLLTSLPFLPLLLAMTVVTLGLEIVIPYPQYAKVLKYLTLTLFAYVITFFLVKHDWSETLVSTFVPRMEWSREATLNIVAIFGTTVSPYLFFWQADEEVEEEIAHHKLKEAGVGKPKITKTDIIIMRRETAVGMIFSNLVAYFIMITSATTLHQSGITNIETASQAAEALRPLAGDFASLLFAAGIIGTGLLAVPVLAGSAGYAVAEALGWKASLGKTYRQVPGFYSIIAFSVLLGVLVNILGVPPFKILYYTAVLNGVCAPPLLFLILLIANNKKIMGKHVNGRVSNILGMMIAVFMSFAAIAVLLGGDH